MRWGKRGRWVGKEGDGRKKNEMVEKREMGGRRGRWVGEEGDGCVCSNSVHGTGYRFSLVKSLRPRFEGF